MAEGRAVGQENNELFDVGMEQKISDILRRAGKLFAPESADLLFPLLTFMKHIRFHMILGLKCVTRKPNDENVSGGQKNGREFVERNFMTLRGLR